MQYKGGKCKDFEKVATESRKIFDDKRANGQSAEGAVLVQQELQKLQAEKESDICKRARESAQQAMAKKKAKRQISLAAPVGL